MTEPEVVGAIIAAGGVVGWVAKVFHGRFSGNGNGADRDLTRERHEAIMRGLEGVVRNLDENGKGTVRALDAIVTEIRDHRRVVEPVVESTYEAVVTDLPRRRKGDG